ncbi:glycosyltransferase [Cupriavidus sp. WS]|uniref:glycosyltransferase n=1 Tax=Cupriavidus sp. WS TaxID=1312922 RepID=UPI0003A891A1|nr:glycosyltransferase [Cupriavidus sp. WS]
MNMKDIVLISTADWDNPFWTNKQHVAVELGKRGNRVLYIDSLGLRRPSVSGQDFRRILIRLGRSLKGVRQVRENIWVWSPIVIPFQGSSLVRLINRLLLRVGLMACMTHLSMKRDILWAYNPMTCRLFQARSFKKLIYHCVDEIKAQPGMPSKEIEMAERELTEMADICFVTAEHLLETRKMWNRNCHYFSNVADFNHFSQALEDSTEIPIDLVSIPSPRVGFIGAISGYKLDLEMICEMARTHPEWSIVLIGKVGEGDPWTDSSALVECQNIHLLGARNYQLLPAYLKGLDVAILPSRRNEYTQGMFPMKFFEYLAAGKPVVSTRLHALAAYAGVASLADNSRAFIMEVERALSGDVVALEERLAAAREHTYEIRTEKMMALIEE